MITMSGKIIANVSANEIQLVGLMSINYKPDRVVQHGHHVRKCIAEEARNAHRDIDPRAAQLTKFNCLQTHDPTRCLIPGGHHTEQCQDLGNVVTTGSHHRRTPDRQAHRLWVVPSLVKVATQQRLGHGLAGLICQTRGDRLRVDGVEVATRRQHIDQSAERRT